MIVSQQNGRSGSAVPKTELDRCRSKKLTGITWCLLTRLMQCTVEITNEQLEE